MSYKLRRRDLFKAAGGAALALPALDFTAPRRAKAGGMAPTRYVFMYAGLSIGRDNDGELVTPVNEGAGYDLRRGLLPLGTDPLPYGGNGFDVQNDVSVVSGLTIPWSDGTNVPPGGKSVHFHYNTVGPIVSGVRGPNNQQNRPNGVSSDQLMADAIAGNTLHRVLSYRVQPSKYIGSTGGEGDAGRISWRDEGGNIQGIDPFFSPRLAHESLFAAFTPPDPAAAEAAAFRLARRRSVVDTVRTRTRSIIPRLGAADKERMERHLAELEGLEARLDAMPPPTTGACEMLPDPGEDPPIGASHPSNGDGGHAYGESAAYSDEDLRAELMLDMVRMAFACDMSRVAAVRLTIDQCFMNMNPLTGALGEVHEMSHGQAADEDHGDAVGWHVKHFARFVRMLADTQELDGSRMLDNTAIVLMFEGGFGEDPQTSTFNRAHSTENMCALVAGGAGGMVHGTHIRAPGMHPCNVTLSAMTAAGYQGNSLGEISGVIDGLFG